jgi:hypothetical protein
MPSIPRPPAEEKPQSPVAAIGILLVAVFAVVIGLMLWSRARRREQPAEAVAQDEQGPGGFQI